MAIRNGENYISEQLLSIFAQTLPPSELVISDDASEDSTLESVMRLIAKAGNIDIRILRNMRPLGYAANFANAIRQCTGDLIFLADQDDVWFPYKISAILNHYEAGRENLFVHDALIVDESLAWSGATVFTQAKKVYHSCDRVNTGALSAFTPAYRDYMFRIPSHYVGHDVWLHEIANALGEKVIVNNPLQVYRRHSANTSKWIVSNISPIRLFDVVRAEVLSSAASSYLQGNALASGMSQLLRERQPSPPGPDVPRLDVAIAYYEKLASDYLARQHLMHLTGLQSKISMVKFFLEGGYKYMRGWKSLARDLLR